ncbi:MAG TPA: fumarylacetoacetate hydrolase family protein [Dehalococcoidia bacterium]|nr:fumarylacetoacetate hydrolase family protein [Dehalococcoidia bacterium]
MTNSNITRYVRYTDGSGTHCGILDGDTIRQLDGYFLDGAQPNGNTARVSDVTLEVPVDPRRTPKVFGVAGAYNRPDAEPRVVPHPRWFSKEPSALNKHEGDVDLPPHATNLNFEGELVLIIGREGKHITEAEAPDYIFGVTVGNDWSENTWFGERLRNGEPPRLISKSMDTWATLYTTIVTGLDYSDLDLEIHLNGELAAKGRTSSMVNSPARLLSYFSHFITLQPGDVIYTGTVAPPSFPGIRRQMQDGDVVEVTIENIGTLRNTVRAMKGKGHEMLWNAELARAKAAGTDPIKAPGATF